MTLPLSGLVPGPRPAMPRADWALALVFAGLTLATRWPYRVGLLPTWDAVQFALALERYDVVRHQPHPPGYILYVALGRLASVLLGDPAAALGGLAIVASAVAVLLLYRLGWHLYGRGVATLAALGLVVSPLFWAYGVVGLAYTAEAALATGVAAGAWAMRQGRVGALLSSAVLLGLAGGVRQSMLLLLSPLWLGMAWRGFRRPGPLIAGLGLVLLTTTAWLAPMLWLTGVDRYLVASRRALRVDGPRHHPPGWRLDPEPRGSGRGLPRRARCLPAGSDVGAVAGPGPTRPGPRPRRVLRAVDAAGARGLRRGASGPARLSAHGAAGVLSPGRPGPRGALATTPGGSACPPRGAAQWRGSPWPGPLARTWRSSRPRAR